jgi:HEAT repeats
LEFHIASDTAAIIAWWTGMSFAALSLCCVAYMFWLRSLAIKTNKRKVSVAEKWDEILFISTTFSDFEPETLGHPITKQQTLAAINKDNLQLEKAELPHFLFQWNYLHESLTGDAKKGLNALGQNLDLTKKSLEMLDSVFVDRQLLAINTLGNLQSDEAYSEIEKLLFNRDPIVSVWAWRALFRMDSARTIASNLEIIANREDWSPIFVAKVLHETDVDLLSVPLTNLVKECFLAKITERQLSRLISYLDLVHLNERAELVSKILHESDQMEVLIACLRLVNSDSDISRVRQLINDSRWEIRLQVVITLGRLNQKEDINLIIDSLNDPDWWVRYRAAGVLTSMPGMSEEIIENLTKTLPNQFSRDILTQVLAEIRLVCHYQPSNKLSK